MSDSEAVFEANGRFYQAFSSADLSAMADIWADDEGNLTVVHPGASAVAGRTGVLKTWQAIFGDDSGVDVICANARTVVYGDIAIVLCTETVNRYRLTATNIFRKTARGWRMVHHHAGPCEVPRRPSDQSESVLH